MLGKITISNKSEGFRILPLFPIAAGPYPYQKPILKAFKDFLTKEDGPKFGFLRAPTGSGKTALALTAARAAEALGTGCFILTAKKFLQTQYVSDYPNVKLANLWGKSNYTCVIGPSLGKTLTCAQCPATTSGKNAAMYLEQNQCHKRCEYLLAVRKAQKGPTTVCNYESYLFNKNYAERFTDRTLLIVDEAHLLPSRLGEFASVEINSKNFSEICDEVKFPSSGTVLSISNWITSAVIPKIDEKLKSIKELFKTVHGEDDLAKVKELNKDSVDIITDTMLMTGESLNEDIRSLEAFKERLVFVENFIDKDPKNWVCDFIPNEKDKEHITIKLRPITLKGISHRYLFGAFAKVLVISATMDNGPFLTDLGVHAKDVDFFLDVPMTFPHEVRPLIFDPVGRMTKDNIENVFPLLVSRVSQFISNHPTEKGIIHTHSFALAKRLAEALPLKIKERVIFHDAGSKDIRKLLEAYKNSPNKWIASPSITEGFDGKGDLVRAQIVLKAPYPSLGDARIVGRQGLPDGRLWYNLQAVYAFMQSYGRGTRGPTDYSVTYVLDSSVDDIVRKSSKYLPPWFVDTWNKSPLENWEFENSRWRLKSQP